MVWSRCYYHLAVLLVEVEAGDKMIYIELLLTSLALLLVVGIGAYIIIGFCFAISGSFWSTAGEDFKRMLYWPIIVRDWWRKKNDV